MIRQILCAKCSQRSPLAPEDVACGWKTREVHICAKTPKGHGITIGGVFHPLEDVRCDHCNDALTGDVVTARTQWRKEPEPRQWETEYGNILPPEAAHAHRVLSGGGK